MKFFKTTIIVLLLFYSYHANGQIVNQVWHLTEKVKLDFNQDPPIVSYTHSYMSDEGITTVTDEDGVIFFTATDIAIYDNNDQVVGNGDNIEGSITGSSAQSPVVLQNPANPTEYYIFYIADHAEDATEGDFKYSILETCTANGELSVGEIKNVQIPGNYSERLHIVEIDKGNYWILTTEIFQNRLYAFKVDENGLDLNPVVSNLGGGLDGQIGKLKINYSKNTLAWSSTFASSAGVKLLDFNINTGNAENSRTIFSGPAYGLVWSPNDEYLYFTDIYSGSKVLSFDIASGGLETLDSKSGDYGFGDLALSPSGNTILVNNGDEKSLDRITNINSGGDYEHNYISFDNNIDELKAGLQNQIIHYPMSSYPKPELGINSVYLIDEYSQSVNIVIDNKFSDVTWSDGQMGNVAIFADAGYYLVEAFFNCCLIKAEFEVISGQEFNEECDQIFNMNLEKDLLIVLDFEGEISDNSSNNLDVENDNVQFSNDRFSELSAGQFGENKKLNLGHNEILKPNFPLSFSFWVKRELSGIGTNYVYTSDLQLDRRAGFAISFGASNDKLIFFYSDENGCYNPGCRRQMTSQRSFPVGEWFHIAIVINAYNDATFYVDGCPVLLDYSGEGDIELFYTEEPSYVGFADNANQSDMQRSYFSGSLDDFYFWNRSITEEEVRYLYGRFQVPSLGLLDIYNFCEEELVMITIDPMFENVTWSDGFEGNERTITEAGNYTIEGFYNCHLVCHEFEVIEVPEVISLGDDIVTCEDQVTLATSVIADWNTGEISNSIIVTQSGTYVANYQSECGVLNDTIVVDLLSNQAISLEDSYEFCLGSSVILSVDDGYESVLWSDGTLGNSIEIFEPGAYQVIGEETVCPSDSHLFIVLVQDTILEIEIDDSILLCDEENTIITAPSGDYQIAWNGIQDGSSFIAEGNQEVQLNLINECDEDQYLINVNSVTSEPIDQIVRTICRGDSLLLMGPADADEYNWSTTDTTSSILITEEGNYSLTYSNEGCVFEAEVASVIVNSCIDCEYYIPNIISTQSTKGNDEFLIKSNHEECLNNIMITVYDRWGSQLFVGPAHEPWDGYFKNKKVTSGVFIVRVTGVFKDDPISITADLTVIH